MRIRLDQQVRFEEMTTATDATYGPQPDGWVPVPGMPVWAEVQDVLPSRSESNQGGIRMSSMPARLRIRYRTGLTSAMRVVLLRGNRQMQIVSGPAEIGRKEYLEFMLQEDSTAGDAA